MEIKIVPTRDSHNSHPSSTSSGVGGKPVRSNVTRRNSVRLSAGGESEIP